MYLYLGLDIDEVLTWSEHIDAVLKKLRPKVFGKGLILQAKSL
jgi:hypothetical protein